MEEYFQYSVNTRIESIYDSRTKTYFQEIFGCYVSGYYRSAVVMLWSVVVADLFFKLKDLVEVYGDVGAEKLLNEIKGAQSKNPTSPEWETTLLCGMERRVPLLTAVERMKLEHLQKLRHSAAHPLLKDDQVLEIPSKQEVEAQIQVSLESVFTKSPIFSSKIWDRFSEDVERVSALTSDSAELEKFLSAKYLNNLRLETLARLFYKLWRVVAHSDDQRCIKNLKANRQALIIFANRNPEFLKKDIRERSDRYSNIQVSDEHLSALYSFFCACPSFFQLFKEPIASAMKLFVKKDSDRYMKGWFISSSIEEHLKDFRDDVSHRTFVVTLKKLGGNNSVLLDWGIRQYSGAFSFAKADERFSNYISPMIPLFSEADFKKLLSSCETNNQTYNRWRANSEYKNLKSTIEEKFPNFDFSPYPNFISAITHP